MRGSAYAAEVEVAFRSHFGSPGRRRRALVTVNERFWNKVDRHGPIQIADLGRCWVWTGSRLGRISCHSARGEVAAAIAIRMLSAVSRCCAPSCRSHSMRWRSVPAQATSRWRETCSSRIKRRRSASVARSAAARDTRPVIAVVRSRLPFALSSRCALATVVIALPVEFSRSRAGRSRARDSRHAGTLGIPVPPVVRNHPQPRSADAHASPGGMREVRVSRSLRHPRRVRSDSLRGEGGFTNGAEPALTLSAAEAKTSTGYRRACGAWSASIMHNVGHDQREREEEEAEDEVAQEAVAFASRNPSWPERQSNPDAEKQEPHESPAKP
jgi:hypothetical protein